MSPPVVRFASVSKAFPAGGLFGSGPPTPALVDVSAQVAAGEIHALVGPNGSGKSTLLRLAAGVLLPDSGTVEVEGKPVGRLPEVREAVGLSTGDERALNLRLSGRDNLLFFGGLAGMSHRRSQERIEELSRSLNLGSFLGRPVHTCSAGMRARLLVARALLHSPRVLLLDEPTKSLDEGHAAQLRTLLVERAQDGQAVVLSTHDPTDLREMPVRVTALAEGRAEPTTVERWLEAR